MRLHADLNRPVRVHAADLDWVPSPMPGVERRRIARVGDEVARVTSLVRYASGSRFDAHTHGGGEEILVLEGTFSDDRGDHRAGTWIRNGVGSRHAPYTDEGCIILVKLWWMHPDETDSKRVDTTRADWRTLTEGIRGLDLHASPHDRTAMVRLEPGASVRLDARRGLELFVVRGAVQPTHPGLTAEPLPRWGWARVPGPDAVSLTATEAATVYAKRGHLAFPPPLPQAAQER